jgi:Calcineurin-like phosphoesterase
MPPKKTRTSTGNTPAGATVGYVFADPKPTPDDYSGFTQQDLMADSNAKTSQNLEPFPTSRRPQAINLNQVLGASAIAQITSAGSLVFHCVGDTGGVKEPSKQFAVADAMTSDLGGKTYQTGLPAFFYHLGDVVYYLGQERYYYDQFYDPYRDYAGPIFAIPGNHDGVVSPSIKGMKSLGGFLENFCTSASGHNPEAQGVSRTTMTQPGVYFTLDAPFVKIIGLYSNTGEGATQGVISGKVVGNAQLTFLLQQLKTAAQQRQGGDKRALIIAVHHPPFTGSENHVPSSNLLADLDSVCKTANILPDIVLSGHAHLYERYTRYVGDNQIPFVVAGMGGYFNLSGFKKTKSGTKPKPPVITKDPQGNKLTLEQYNDQDFGYLVLTVSPTTLNCTFVSVDPQPKGAAIVGTGDSFTLDLVRHTVSTP